MRENLAGLPKSELVQAIHDGPSVNGHDLSKVDLSGVNLARANMTGVRLDGADLSGAYVQGVIARDASFAGANMRDAALPGGSLAGASFRGTDLRATNLCWAHLEDANLFEVNLAGAQLFEAKLAGVNMKDADLTGAKLESAELSGARLPGALLTNAVLHSANCRGADLTGADMRRCDLRGTVLVGATLVNAQLEGAVYDDSTVFPDGYETDGSGMVFLGPAADLSRISLENFEFRGENLSRANLSRANLSGSDLRGADLCNADLSGARLRGALYDVETQFPRDFDAEKAGAYAVVPLTVIRSATMQWKHLAGAALSGAQLVGADLTGADLTGAQLNSTDLTGANLYSANLTGAGLHAVVFIRAKARGVILQGADLRRADLRNADLSWADFAEADLRGAELVGASLDGASFRSARYDERTTFPEGFDPVAARMKDGDVAANVRPVDMGADEAELVVEAGPFAQIERGIASVNALTSWVHGCVAGHPVGRFAAVAGLVLAVGVMGVLAQPEAQDAEDGAAYSLPRPRVRLAGGGISIVGSDPLLGDRSANAVATVVDFDAASNMQWPDEVAGVTPRQFARRAALALAPKLPVERTTLVDGSVPIIRSSEVVDRGSESVDEDAAKTEPVAFAPIATTDLRM